MICAGVYSSQCKVTMSLQRAPGRSRTIASAALWRPLLASPVTMTATDDSDSASTRSSSDRIGVGGPDEAHRMAPAEEVALARLVFVERTRGVLEGEGLIGDSVLERKPIDRGAADVAIGIGDRQNLLQVCAVLIGPPSSINRASGLAEWTSRLTSAPIAAASIRLCAALTPSTPPAFQP